MAESYPSKIDVIWREGRSLEKGGYPGLNPRTFVENGLRGDIDVAVPMRDGITIRVDVLRPAEQVGQIPAIIAWSPYGKHDTGAATMDRYPNRAMVPEGTPGDWAKFEGPDPDYWCANGYAIINPDSRGTFGSEGDVFTVGGTEADDIHDLIEWVGTQDWCNGKVAMSGNSWLAQCQWFAAETKPPHLAAIAPWEGWSDLYRENVAPGGITTEPMNWMKFIWAGFCSEQLVEDVPAMLTPYPTWNEYWNSKQAHLEDVTIPAYVVASWNSRLHSHGSFEAFKQLGSAQKWLRIHDGWEWPDYYTPLNVEDLRRFFDHFLKDVDNGWETTPPVRIAVMDAVTDKPSEHYRAESTWPLARTEHRALYLDAGTGTMLPEEVLPAAAVDYDAVAGQTTFDYRFTEDTELTGHMSLKLWVEAIDGNDLDLFVVAQKLSASGERVDYRVYGMDWAAEPARGFLRASHRELDPIRSRPEQPWHTHRIEQLLAPGEVVEVDIEFWPMGCKWHAGETIRIVVAGHPLLHAGDPVSGSSLRSSRNQGRHIIHTGGANQSRLLVPVAPSLN